MAKGGHGRILGAGGASMKTYCPTARRSVWTVRRAACWLGGASVISVVAGTCLAAAIPPSFAAPAEVILLEEPLTMPFRFPGVQETSEFGRTVWRDAALAAPGAGKDDPRPQAPIETERTEPSVRIENRWVRVRVLPRWGGVVQSAQAKPGEEDYFVHIRMFRREWPYWQQGVKLSFPFAEHGSILIDQPCAWRRGRTPTGGILASLWQENSRFNHRAPAHHYVETKRGTQKRLLPASHSSPDFMHSDLLVSQIVSVEPDHAAFSIAYRLVNPTAWRQGRRCWNTAFLPRAHTASGAIHWPAPLPSEPLNTEYILPSVHVSHHFAQHLRHTPACLVVDRLPPDDQTLFAWEAPYGFTGAWYPEPRINRLRLTEIAKAPGTKWWAHPFGPAGRTTHQGGVHYGLELWGGTDTIFEGIEHWLEPGEEYRFIHTFLLAKGIGKAEYADREVVFHLAGGDTPRLEVVTLRPRAALAVSFDGAACGAPVPCAPDRPAIVSLPGTNGRVRLVADGHVIFDRRLPLELKADETRYAAIKAAHEINAITCEMANAKKGYAQPDYRFALDPKKGHPDPSVARGRVLLRDGQVAAAQACLRAAMEQAPEDGEGWHLLGAALLEAGHRDEAVQAFEKALTARARYPAAGYLLAVAMLAEGGADPARATLARLVEARPRHVQARLLHTWLLCQKDPRVALREAERLEADDPADPRHVAVLEHARRAAGRSAEAAAAQSDLAALCEHPGAQLRLDEFLAATRGEYRPPLRRGYPEEKKP
jgi:Flp pilus assembly protein TadD